MKFEHYNKWKRGEYDLICNRCESTNVMIRKNGPHFERVCVDCRKWLGWLPRILAKHTYLIKDRHLGRDYKGRKKKEE